MTTDEAKAYLIEHTHLTDSDFEKASKEDVACELANEGEWVRNFYSSYPINEWEMRTAIEMAQEHQFHNDQEQIDSYVDFMMGTMNFKQ